MKPADLGKPTAFSLWDAAWGMARAFGHPDPDWQPKFWAAFSDAWGCAVANELDLANQWDPERALSAFKKVSRQAGYGLGGICPPEAFKAIKLSLDSTVIGKRGKRASFLESEILGEREALNLLFGYENESQIAGTATNPLVHELGLSLANHYSVVVTDGRRDVKLAGPNRECVAGVAFQTESVMKVKVTKYHPLIWLAMKYRSAGIRTLVYLAQNA